MDEVLLDEEGFEEEPQPHFYENDSFRRFLMQWIARKLADPSFTESITSGLSEMDQPKAFETFLKRLFMKGVADLEKMGIGNLDARGFREELDLMEKAENPEYGPNQTGGKVEVPKELDDLLEQKWEEMSDGR
ncbi:MAG: hypothetical protein SWH78_17645 [Thermodesulfobacteriota bacterium]|nr:hypothetical protein [Thermodesulfobacteriota bacterium]